MMNLAPKRLLLAAALSLALAHLTSCGKPGAQVKSAPETPPFRSEVYRSVDDRHALTVVSPDELELRENGVNLICKYTRQEKALRVVATIMGTTQAIYFKPTREGIQSEGRPNLYAMSKLGAARSAVGRYVDPVNPNVSCDLRADETYTAQDDRGHLMEGVYSVNEKELALGYSGGWAIGYLEGRTVRIPILGAKLERQGPESLPNGRQGGNEVQSVKASGSAPGPSSPTAPDGLAEKCLANAKKIWMACQLYSVDNNGQYPKELGALIPGYLPDKSVFSSPLAPRSGTLDYDYFGSGIRDTEKSALIFLRGKYAGSDGKRSVVRLNDHAVTTNRDGSATVSLEDRALFERQ